MATITNKSASPKFVPGLGILEPGDNTISKAQESKFKAQTGKKLKDLESPTLKVKTTAAKKEDS